MNGKPFVPSRINHKFLLSFMFREGGYAPNRIVDSRTGPHSCDGSSDFFFLSVLLGADVGADTGRGHNGGEKLDQ